MMYVHERSVIAMASTIIMPVYFNPAIPLTLTLVQIFLFGNAIHFVQLCSTLYVTH